MLDKDLLLDIPDGSSQQVGNNPLLFEKQVIYVGDFKKRDPNTGAVEYEFSVDEKTLDHWITQHDKMTAAGLEVPMPEGHTEKPSARRGTVLSLSKRPDSKGRMSLFAKAAFKDAETAKTFSQAQVSLHSPHAVYHGEHTFVRPIRHICFTDYPAIAGLDPLTTIAASYDKSSEEDSMELKNLAKKLGISFTNETTDVELSAQIETIYNNAVKPDNSSKDLLLSTTRELRSTQIDNLVHSHKITTARGKELKDLWAGDKMAISLDNTNAFNSVLEALKDLKPLVELSGEQTPGQNVPEKKNALVADAEKRAAKAAS